MTCPIRGESRLFSPPRVMTRVHPVLFVPSADGIFERSSS